MISADSDTEKVSKCIELGAEDYLPKPFNPIILRARIGAALRQGSPRALQSEYVGKMEQAKKDSENLLKNMLPAEIAVRLRNGESNIADHFDEATVMTRARFSCCLQHFGDVALKFVGETAA